MLVVAGGILLAVLVLFLLPLILSLSAFVLAAIVVFSVVALLVVTDTGQTVLGVAVLAGAVFGAFGLWGAFQGQRTRQRADGHGIPKVGASDYLAWANHEGAYAHNTQAQIVQLSKAEEGDEYLLWANREGRYADPLVSSPPRSRTEARVGGLSRVVRSWLYR